MEEWGEDSALTSARLPHARGAASAARPPPSSSSPGKIRVAGGALHQIPVSETHIARAGGTTPGPGLGGSVTWRFRPSEISSSSQAVGIAFRSRIGGSRGHSAGSLGSSLTLRPTAMRRQALGGEMRRHRISGAGPVWDPVRTLRARWARRSGAPRRRVCAAPPLSACPQPAPGISWRACACAGDARPAEA